MVYLDYCFMGVTISKILVHTRHPSFVKGRGVRTPPYGSLRNISHYSYKGECWHLHRDHYRQDSFHCLFFSVKDRGVQTPPYRLLGKDLSSCRGVQTPPSGSLRNNLSLQRGVWIPSYWSRRNNRSLQKRVWIPPSVSRRILNHYKEEYGYYHG